MLIVICVSTLSGWEKQAKGMFIFSPHKNNAEDNNNNR